MQYIASVESMKQNSSFHKERQHSMNDIKYIGNGEFIVTEQWLHQTLKDAIEMRVGNTLGIDNWPGWAFYDEGIDGMYPEYAGNGYDAEEISEKLLDEAKGRLSQSTLE